MEPRSSACENVIDFCLVLGSIRFLQPCFSILKKDWWSSHVLPTGTESCQHFHIMIVFVFFTRENFSVWVWRAHTHWQVPHTFLLENYPKTSKSSPKLKNIIKYPSLRLESSRSIKIINILYFPISTLCVHIKLSRSKKKCLDGKIA